MRFISLQGSHTMEKVIETTTIHRNKQDIEGVKGIAYSKSQSGFTLLELMIVVAIVAILAAIAIPSMQSLILSSKLDAKRNTLVSAIKLARSEAVSRGTQGRVCSSNDGAACGGDYSDGWIVQAEDDGGNFVLVESFQKSTDDLTINGDFAGVTFTSNGMATAGGNTDMEFCPPEGFTLPCRGFDLSLVGSVTLTP